MTDKSTEADAGAEGRHEDVASRGAGAEPMTPAQRSDLKALCEHAQLPFDEKLTRAEASRRIGELRAKRDRGEPQENPGVENGLTSPDPTGNPGSLGRKEQEVMPRGAPSSA